MNKKDHPLYGTWRSMRTRCENPKAKQWKDYGGRGISVCQEWSDFLVFCQDVGEKPGRNMSLDRINNDGNYEPGNVRWASAHQQMRNTRGNLLVQFQGQTKCVAAWAEEFSVNYALLLGRIKSGWPIEDAFATPSGDLRPYRSPKNIFTCTTNVDHNRASDDLTPGTASRPKLPEAIVQTKKDDGFYIRLPLEDKEFLLKMGGAKWIRACLDVARSEAKEND